MVKKGQEGSRRFKKIQEDSRRFKKAQEGSGKLRKAQKGSTKEGSIIKSARSLYGSRRLGKIQEC